MIRDLLKSNNAVAVEKFRSKSENFPYPNINATPTEKASKPYAKAQAYALYSEFIRNQLSIPFNWDTNEGGVEDFKILRAYSHDNQPVQKYQKMFGYQKKPDDLQGSRKAKQQISWAIKSPVRRYVDGIKGAMSGIKHAILIKGVDSYSTELEQEKKFRMIALQKNEKYHQINQRLNTKSPMPEVKFGDEEELDIIMKTDQRFESNHAIAMKQILMYTLDDVSNFTEIEADLLEDQIVLGWACAHVAVDNITNKSYVQYIDPECLLIPYSKHKNYADADRAGHIVPITFTDLCREAKKAPDGGPSMDELYEIAAKYSMGAYTVDNIRDALGTMNGAGQLYAGTIADRIKIPVMFFEWKDWTPEKRVYRKREGNPTFAKKVPLNYKNEGNNEEILNTEHECWYYGKWVVGTDTMIDWGRLPFTEAQSSGKTKCRYKVYKSSKKSIVSQMIPTVDAKQILWIKYQDAWIKARPPGMDINTTALMGITDAQGNIIHPSEIIKNKVATGIGMYAQTFNRNDPKFGTQGKPFEYDEGSVGVIVEKFADSDAKLDMDLTKTTGITENMLGSEAKPNQLVQVTEMLIAGSHNRLQPIYNGVFQIKREVVQGVVTQTQALALHVPKDKPFYPEISDLKKAALRIGRDALKFQFGISIRVIASDTMKQVVVAAVAESQAKGIMSGSDALRVFEMVENGYYEEAQRYLAYKEKKAAEAAAENEQMMMKINNEAQQQAAQTNNDAKLQQQQADAETKKMLAQLTAQLKILTDNNNAANQMRIDENQARLDLIDSNRDREVEREQIEANKEIAEKKAKEKPAAS